MQRKSWMKEHKRALIFIVIVAAVISLVGLVLADQQSVTVHMSWTVLPFQELRIAGSTSHGSSQSPRTTSCLSPMRSIFSKGTLKR